MPKDKEKKAKSRKADAFAGKGSFADRLRKRRQALERGDVEGAYNAMRDKQSTDSNNY